jgi:cellulose synthase/poly-beta-1,6-N-acetylglucosamine synthase-like glycosyltransferase
LLAALFWTSVSLVAYTYLIYPALLWLLTVRRRPPGRVDPDTWPTVSLLITAHDEAAVIREKLDNTLALEYPRDRLQIIVVSDCSADGTDEIAAGYADRGVLLHRQLQRAGKTAAQNAGARLARGEILVFSDANSMYGGQALKALARSFADPWVGCVCGELRYANPEQAGAGKGEGMYWRYEQFLKRRESRLASLVGANGSIYAVRRELFEDLGPDIISDFIMPIRVWRRGFRVVYEPAAVAVEHSAKGFRDEFRRRTRIIARSLHGLRTEAGVLNPFAGGLFAFQLISHKLLRWLVPLFLLGAWSSSAVLAGQPLYRAVFAVQTVFYLLAALGNLDPRHLGRVWLFYVPAYFTAINLGALVGLAKFLSGRRYTVWQPVSRG